MNEEYLLGAYNSFGGQEKLRVDFKTWVSKIKDNDNYKQGMFNNFGGQEKLGASYNDWNSRVFGINKQKEVVSEEKEISPVKNVEKKNNVSFATEEQMKELQKSTGLSDADFKAKNESIKISASKRSKPIVAEEDIRKKQYTKEERSGLFDVNKETGNTELIGLENDPLQVDIEGFNNPKFQIFTEKMKESATLSQEEIRNIDLEIERKRKGDFTTGEKIKSFVSDRFSLVGDLFGLKNEKELKQVSAFDRQELINEAIRQKQSNFFKELDPEEKDAYNQYLNVRKEKITEQYKESEFVNTHLSKFVYPKVISDYKGLEDRLKALSLKKKEDITEADVQEYNSLASQLDAKGKEIKKLDEQYIANRDYLLNATDDVLSFDRELDLAKRDYSWIKNRPVALFKNVQYMAENVLSFTGNLMLEAQKRNMNPTLEEGDNIFKEWSKSTSKRKTEFEEGINIKKEFSEVNSISDFGEYTMNLIVDQVPNYAMLYVTGTAGVGVLGASSGGDRLGGLLVGKEMGENDFNYSDITKNAAMYALSEAAFETVTAKMLGDYKGIFKSIKESKILRDSFKESAKKTFNSIYTGVLNANQEGLSEVGTGIGQYLADKFILNEDKDLDLTEEYFAGAMMGGGSHVFMGVANKVVGEYSSSKKRTKVRDNIREIVRTEKIIRESGNNLNKEVLFLYQDKINKLNAENNLIINSSAETARNLTPIQRREVSQINNKLKALQIALNEEKVKETKDVLLNEISVLSKRKDNIIEPETEVKSSLKETTKKFGAELGELKDLSEIGNDLASLQIDGANTVLSSDGDKIVIQSFNVPNSERGKGVAKNALQKIVDLADKRGMNISLEVKPLEEGITRDGLISLYESVGFEIVEGNKMERVANAKKEETDFDLNVIDNIINETETPTTETKEQKVLPIEDKKAEIKQRRKEEMLAIGDETTEMTEEEIKETAGDRIERRVKANAKYDAELKALENEVPNETITLESLKNDLEGINLDDEAEVETKKVDTENTSLQELEGKINNENNNFDFTAKSGNKVVDEKGEPITVYHTTNVKNIKEFKTSGEIETLGGRVKNEGAYFTPKKGEYANKGGEEYAVQISIKNPYITTDQIESAIISPKKKAELVSKGHDGVILMRNGKAAEYIVFDKSQIKLENQTNKETQQKQEVDSKKESASVSKTNKIQEREIDQEAISKMKELALIKPELKSLMDDAIFVYNEFHKIDKKGGGLIKEMGKNNSLFSENIGVEYPFIYRIYNQQTNNRTKKETVEKDLQSFVENIEKAKEYLKNKPSNEVLEKRRNEIEQRIISKEIEIEKNLKEAKERIETKNKTREKIVSANKDFIIRLSNNDEINSMNRSQNFIIEYLEKGYSQNQISFVFKFWEILNKVPDVNHSLNDVFKYSERFNLNPQEIINSLEKNPTNNLFVRSDLNSIISELNKEVQKNKDQEEKIKERLENASNVIGKPNKKGVKSVTIKTNLNEYQVSLVNGELEITPRVGKTVSKNEEKKVKDLYAESIDFSAGKIANFEGMAEADPNQITERVIEDSENPIEIASEIRKVRERDNQFNQDFVNISKDDAIYQVLSKQALTENSKTQVTNLGAYYTNVGFRTNKQKIGIDKARELAEGILGQEVSFQDILTFLETYENLSNYSSSIQTLAKNQESDLKEKFKTVTGLELTESLMDTILPESEMGEDLGITFESDNEEDVPFQTQSASEKRLVGINLTNLVDKLNLTGLAKAVYVWSGNEINKFLDSIGVNSDLQKQTTESGILKEVSKGKLAVVHNLSLSKLLNALKVGGLPVPSLAIVNTDNPYTSFGDITLVADKSLIDPKKAKNKVFGADVYSVRYPSVSYEASLKLFNGLKDRMKNAFDFELTGRSISNSDFFSNGRREISDNEQIRLLYLKERGLLKSIQMYQPGRDVSKPDLDAFEKIVNKKKQGNYIDSFEYTKPQGENYTEFVVLVNKMLLKEIEAKKDSEYSDYFKKAWFDENGNAKEGIIYDRFNQLNSAYKNKQNPKIDVYKTLQENKFDENSQDFTDFVDELIDGLNVKEKIFTGYTNDGTAKYIPHSLENVVRLMKNKDRGSEGFFYGAPSLRSMVTPRFKTIKEIQENRNKIADDQTFEKIKEEINSEFDDLTDLMKDSVKSTYSHNGELASEAMYEVYKRGYSEDYNLSKEQVEKIVEFMDKLVSLPTEYFEVKIDRAVSISEFNTAIVPKDTPKKVINELEKNGLVVKVYEHESNGNRLSNISEDLKFQKQLANKGAAAMQTPTWFSTAKQGLSIIDQKSATPEQWVKMIIDKGGKGTAQELEWIGLQDFLNDWKKENEAKSIPKEVVEQYINDNQIEIVEVTKGGFNPFENWTDKELADYYESQDGDPQGKTRQQMINDLVKWESEDMGSIGNREEGDPKYSQYQLEGGKNYREVLLTLPNRVNKIKVNSIKEQIEFERKGYYIETDENGNDYAIKKEKTKYKSSHWEESNILAHIRLNERTLPNGERVLFIEEVQSDWAQEGKKKGFIVGLNEQEKKEKDRLLFAIRRTVEEQEKNEKGSYNYVRLEETADKLRKRYRKLQLKEVEGAPQMPYKKTDQWVGMAMRRVMQMAVQEGFDRIAWVTGEQSADRYDLSKEVERIKTEKVEEVDGLYFVDIVVKNGVSLELEVENGIIRDSSNRKEFIGKPLEDVIGKDISKKILSEDSQTIVGNDLKIGGEGMKTFYNSILPKVAKQEAQRFDKEVKVDVVDFKGQIKDTKNLEKEYNKWLEENKMPDMSADDLLFERKNELTQGQKDYLNNFIDEWNLSNGDNQSTQPGKQLSIKLTDKSRNNLGTSLPLFQQQQNNSNENIYGFVHEGSVYLNRDIVRLDTPIHEFGHLWINFIKDKHKDVYDRGIALIKGSQYHIDVKNNPSYAGLKESAQLEEALAQAIGEKGVKILEQTKLKQFQVWFRNVFRKIAQGFGLRNMTPDQLANITLDKFTLFASAELLSGQQIIDRQQKTTGRKDVDITNIDIIMESEKARMDAFNKLKQKVEEKRGLEKDVKKEIQDYILNAFEGSALMSFIRKAELSKLLTMVRDGKTFNNLQKAIENIDELLPKLEERLKEYNADIKKTKEDLRVKLASEKQLTENIRKEVVKFILAQIDGRNINEIKKREINSLLTVVKNTKSIAGILNAFDKVDEIFVKVDNKVVFKSIKKILERKLSKKVYGRTKANLVTEEAETILNVVKETIKNLKKKNSENLMLLNTLLDKQDTILQKVDKVENDYLELEGLDASIKLLNAILSDDFNKTNELLYETLEQVKDIYDNGRSELKALRQAQRDYLDGKLEEYRDDAGFEKSQNSLKTTQDLDREARRFVNQLARGIFETTSGWISGSLDSLMTIVSKGKFTDRDSSPLVDLVNRMKAKERNKKTRINAFSEMLVNKQKELFGSQRRAEIAFKKIREVTVRRRYDELDPMSPIGQEKVRHTESELLNLWMNYKNKDLRPALALNGYDTQFFDELELSNELQSYGEFLYDFYEMMHKDSDAVYKRMYFHSMGKVDYYAGKVSRRGDGSPQSDLSPDGSNFSVHTTGFGSQKARISNAPIVAVDANRLAFRAIAETSHFIAYAEIHKEYTALLKDEKFNKAVKFNNPKYGDQIVKALDFYKTFALEKGGVEKGYAVLDFFGRNIVRSTLGAKIKVGVTQMVSFLNGASDLPPTLEKNFMTYYNPKAIVDGFRELTKISEFLKIRYDIGGLENAVTGLTDIANSDGIFNENSTLEANRRAVGRFMDQVLNKLMLNVKIGDAVGTAGAVPVYLAWKDVYEKQGFSKEEAQRKALLKFESSADRSQQTNSVFGKSQFQSHPVLRYFAMYATSPIQNMQNANYHWRELFRNLSKEKNGKGTNAQNIIGILNYQFAQPVIYTYLAQLFAGSVLAALGFGDDEPDDTDKTLASAYVLSNYGSIPMVGGIITLMVDTISGKDFTYGGLISSALLKSLSDLDSDFKTWERTKNPVTAEKYKKRVLKRLGALILAVPDIFTSAAMEFEDIYWNDEIDTMVKVWKALGYSNYAIEESRKARITREKADKIRKMEQIKYDKALKNYKPPKNKVNQLFLKGKNER